MQGNWIAYSALPGRGVRVGLYPANTLRRNAIWGNEGAGVLLTNDGNRMLPAPVLTAVTPDKVSGTACPGCKVEVFSDDEDEGRSYESTAVADASGNFCLVLGSPLAGAYVTATATDGGGNTSGFSAPDTPAWRLYLPLVLRGLGGRQSSMQNGNRFFAR